MPDRDLASPMVVAAMMAGTARPGPGHRAPGARARETRWRRRSRALEAALLLTMAWICVRVLPFRWTAPLLGVRQAPGAPLAASRPGPQAARARAVRAALNAADRRLPWHSTCLMRTLAGRLMLGRRGCSSVARLGVTSLSGAAIAHAWLEAEGVDVTGGAEAAGYQPIAEFVATAPPRPVRSASGPPAARDEASAPIDHALEGAWAGQFQPIGDTALDRYPRCFDFVRARLGAEADLRILSFGCATGEEVFSLARWFDRASIRGLDVNPRAIAAAQRAAPPDRAARLSFAVASSADGEPAEFYDAVFAMAVFRHHDLEALAPARCDHLIRFADFQRVVAGLADCLKPGGLLVLRHAHFQFADTSVARRFEPVLRLDLDPRSSIGPLYGPDDRLIPDAEPVREAVWRKL